MKLSKLSEIRYYLSYNLLALYGWLSLIWFCCSEEFSAFIEVVVKDNSQAMLPLGIAFILLFIRSFICILVYLLIFLFEIIFNLKFKNLPIFNNKKFIVIQTLGILCIVIPFLCMMFALVLTDINEVKTPTILVFSFVFLSFLCLLNLQKNKH